MDRLLRIWQGRVLMDQDKDPSGGGGGEPAPKNDEVSAQIAALKAELDALKKGKSEPAPSDVDKVRKDLQEKAAREAAIGRMQEAIRFNLSSDKFMEENKEHLGPLAPGLYKEISSKAFTDEEKKAAAVKKGMLEYFFSLQENIDAAPEELKGRIMTFKALADDEKEKQAVNYWDTLTLTVSQKKLTARIEAAKRANGSGKTFYSKNGEAIKFNKAGIGKGVSSAAETDKLLMLDNAPKISSGAVPLPFEYIKDPYIKTMAAPVSAGGRKDIALITLEAQKNKPVFFHNINPISYWAGKYGGFKKGIPSKSSWYQGKGQKNAPRFAHPAYKSGAMPKGNNNIANNNKKVNALRKSQKAYKMGDVFKDGSILALRPFSLGYNGALFLNGSALRKDAE